ncbi:MAG: sialidase family protein [Eubacteriales bacterium]|nr:sialidase family protein [Eubacteriales bacterium]
MARLTLQEIIDVPTPSCHATTVARVGGETLLCWFGGTQEAAGDVDIYMARRGEFGWGRPFLIAGERDLPHWNPVLFADGENVALYYKVGRKIPQWHTRAMFSEDGGRRFSAPQELVPGDIGGRGPVKNKPILLRSGRMISGASVETPTTWNAFADLSDDGGKTFRRSAFVPLWREGEKPCENARKIDGKGVIQPTLWEDETGVHMLLRSTEGEILRSDSTDGGETWCCAYGTGMPNNNSGVDLAQDERGRLWLCANPVSENWGARTPLSLFVSEDGGAHFERVMDLETAPGEYSYPAILAQEGKLFVSYTWNREKVAYCEIEP